MLHRPGPDGCASRRQAALGDAGLERGAGCHGAYRDLDGYGGPGSNRYQNRFLVLPTETKRPGMTERKSPTAVLREGPRALSDEQVREIEDSELQAVLNVDIDDAIEKV